MTRLTIAIGLASLLAACSPTQLQTSNTTVDKTIATVQADYARAKQFWGIAKGMALVAEISQPGLATTLDPWIARGDTLIATGDTVLAGAIVDTAAVQALVTQVNDQAKAVTVQAAPAIKVVPGKA